MGSKTHLDKQPVASAVAEGKQDLLPNLSNPCNPQRRQVESQQQTAAKAMPLTHGTPNSTQFIVRLIDVIVDGVVLSGQRPEIFALASKYGICPGG